MSTDKWLPFVIFWGLSAVGKSGYHPARIRGNMTIPFVWWSQTLNALPEPAADGRSVSGAIPGQFHQVRTYLKKRILVQNQGGREYQTGGILVYFEDLI